MSRPASGDEAALINAREAIAAAQTVEQLRQAQAVVLPLDYAMSLADTAQIIGVSPGWACQLRKALHAGPSSGLTRFAHTRGAQAREHERGGGTRILGPLLGIGGHRWRVGGGSNQGGTGQASGAQSSTGFSLQPAAPSQLEKARARQAPPPKRSGGSAGVEKKTPRNPRPNPHRLGARPTHQIDVSR